MIESIDCDTGGALYQMGWLLYTEYQDAEKIKKLISLGEEMTKIKNETSGIPPRLLDTAKKHVVERFEIALDEFGSTLSQYGQYNLDLGISMIKNVLHTFESPEFSKVTNQLLNQTISEKIINRLKYEDANHSNDSNKRLRSFLEYPPTKTMKP